MTTFTVDRTTKVKLTYDQTVDLVVKFLESEFDSYTEGLTRHCRDYIESGQDYCLQDVKDNVDILNAINKILYYYKAP